MQLRIKTARLLLQLGDLFQPLAIMIMKPDDLIEFSRQTYANPYNVNECTREDITDSGLDPDEKALLEKLPTKQGNLLLLGLGGGRDAIGLSQSGFDVTGIDFLPQMVERALLNTKKRGISIKAFVQEISQLDFPDNAYHVVWLSSAMYSCIPTQQRRTAMLRKIHQALIQNGYFICQFQWEPDKYFSPIAESLKKLFGYITYGNTSYEKGDTLWNGSEFIHSFSDEHDLTSEFEAGGFSMEFMHFNTELMLGGAVLRKG